MRAKRAMTVSFPRIDHGFSLAPESIARALESVYPSTLHDHDPASPGPSLPTPTVHCEGAVERAIAAKRQEA